MNDGDKGVVIAGLVVLAFIALIAVILILCDPMIFREYDDDSQHGKEEDQAKERMRVTTPNKVPISLSEEQEIPLSTSHKQQDFATTSSIVRKADETLINEERSRISSRQSKTKFDTSPLTTTKLIHVDTYNNDLEDEEKSEGPGHGSKMVQLSKPRGQSNQLPPLKVGSDERPATVPGPGANSPTKQPESLQEKFARANSSLSIPHYSRKAERRRFIVINGLIIVVIASVTAVLIIGFYKD